jgi:Ca2+-binding RTX toxin-like protein
MDQSPGGNDGDDKIHGLGGSDEIYGRPSSDVVCGEPGNDTLCSQVLNGCGDEGNNDDVLYGGDGSDDFYACNGEEVLYGGDGNDFLFAAEDGGGIRSIAVQAGTATPLTRSTM